MFCCLSSSLQCITSPVLLQGFDMNHCVVLLRSPASQRKVSHCCQAGYDAAAPAIYEVQASAAVMLLGIMYCQSQLSVQFRLNYSFSSRTCSDHHFLGRCGMQVLKAGQRLSAFL